MSPRSTDHAAFAGCPPSVAVNVTTGVVAPTATVIVWRVVGVTWNPAVEPSPTRRGPPSSPIIGTVASMLPPLSGPPAPGAREGDAEPLESAGEQGGGRRDRTRCKQASECRAWRNNLLYLSGDFHPTRSEDVGKTSGRRRHRQAPMAEARQRRPHAVLVGEVEPRHREPLAFAALREDVAPRIDDEALAVRLPARAGACRAAPARARRPGSRSRARAGARASGPCRS